MLAGAARGASNAVTVTLGTGVGGGIIIDGRLFTGFHYGGAELGHMGIVLGGRKCTCGRRGCLEAYASRHWADPQHERGDGGLPGFPDVGSWPVKTAEMCPQNRFSGSGAGRRAAAQAVVNDYIQHLGYGLASIINILAPEILVIGGGVSNEGENLLRPLVECVRPQLYIRTPEKQTRIVLATLGNDAGLIGAAFLSRAQ